MLTKNSAIFNELKVIWLLQAKLSGQIIIEQVFPSC